MELLTKEMFPVGELVTESDINWVDLEMSVEDATKVRL